MHFQPAATISSSCHILLQVCPLTSFLPFLQTIMSWPNKRQTLPLFTLFLLSSAKLFSSSAWRNKHIFDCYLDFIKCVGSPWCSLSTTCVLIREQECGLLFWGEVGWLWGTPGLWHPFNHHLPQVCNSLAVCSMEKNYRLLRSLHCTWTC